MISAPRAGLRPSRGSTGSVVAPRTTVGGTAASSSAEESASDLGDQQQQQQPQQQQQQQHGQEQAPVYGGGEEQGSDSAVETNEAGLEPSPAVVPLRRSISSAGSFSSGFGAVTDRGVTPERVAAKEVSGATDAAAPTAAEVHATPAANSVAADRDDGSLTEEVASEQIDAGGAAEVADEPKAPPEDKGAETDEVHRLRAELDRLKREMASIAAAAAKDTTTPPIAQSKRGNARRPSPRIEVSSPNISSTRNNHSTWEWDPTAVGTDESSDAGKSTRPVSARLRADDSWMYRRRSVDSGDGSQHNRQSTSGDAPVSNGTGFGSTARAASVLPPPGSDGARGRSRAPSEAGGGDQSLPEEGGLLLSPPASAVRVEGPSPASGEKDEEAKAAAADSRRRLASGSDSTEEGSGGSARSNSSMRQMSVFFPVQQQSPERKAAQFTADSRAAEAEGAAALARAAATQIGATASPPEAARAAQAARNAVAAKQQQAATRHVAAAPVVYSKLPVTAGASCAGGGCRWRGSGDSNGRVWRWVLAQRTRNQTVRQAVISHGLPRCGRRHIWAAWAAVATPET